MHTRRAIPAALFAPLISFAGCSDEPATRPTAPATTSEVSARTSWTTVECFYTRLQGRGAQLNAINEIGTAAVGRWTSFADVNWAVVVWVNFPNRSCPTHPNWLGLRPLLPGGNTEAVAASSSTDPRGSPKFIVGTSQTQSGDYHAVLWVLRNDPRGDYTWEVQDLGTLGGRSSTAKDVTDQGDVVGISEDATGATHGFLKKFGENMLDLDVITGWNFYPTAIGPQGMIAGAGIAPGSKKTVAVIHTQDGMVRVGPTDPVTFGSSSVTGFNDSGIAVGYYTVGYHQFRSFVTDWPPAAGVWRKIPTPENADSSFQGLGINNSVQVVGQLSEMHAAFWGGQFADWSFLKRPGAQSSAQGISSDRKAVGWKLVNGVPHAVLWYLDPPAGTM